MLGVLKADCIKGYTENIVKNGQEKVEEVRERGREAFCLFGI